MILFYNVLRYLSWRDKKISFKPKGDKCHYLIGFTLRFTIHYFDLGPKLVKYLQKSQKNYHFLPLVGRPSCARKEEETLQVLATTWCKSPKNICLHPFLLHNILSSSATKCLSEVYLKV